MEQRRQWKSYGWEGALLLVGALAVGAFAGTRTWHGHDRIGSLAPAGARGAGRVNGAGGSFAGDAVALTAPAVRP